MDSDPMVVRILRLVDEDARCRIARSVGLTASCSVDDIIRHELVDLTLVLTSLTSSEWKQVSAKLSVEDRRRLRETW
jgi:hypothetical protein